MRFLVFLLFCAFCISITGCSKEESNSDPLINGGLVGTWNTINTSGGFAGINCDYQPGEIVWVFDAEDNLTITYNVINTSALCGGQELGMVTSEYKYGILSSNDKKFLLLDDNERGEIIVSTTEFILDQNSYSGGTGADGFFMTFVK